MLNRVLSGKTKICGLIGDPLGQTMSPLMHNTAFEKIGADYLYVPFTVKKGDLGKAIDGMRALNLRGLNVTMPHKVAVIQFLDELDDLADKIGAVNTIVNNDGVLKGYNTDGGGFLQSLLERGIEPKGKSIVILGAGGASRAVSFILADRGASLVMLNRTLSKVEELADRLSKAFPGRAEALQLNEKNLATALGKADILVNATSLGMAPNVDETPVSSSLLKPDLVVADAVYNPIKTRLLREAEEVGAKIVSGVNMVVWQGALAFEKWTGLKAPVEMMREVVIARLTS